MIRPDGSPWWTWARSFCKRLVAGANFREDNTARYTGTFGPLTLLAHCEARQRAGA